MTGQGLFSVPPGAVTAFVRDQKFALVLSRGAGGTMTSPLPLLVETEEEGAVTSFIGHFARANPQLDLVRHDPRATILFQGPHAYIPPGWISQPDWAPTWNYAFAQFDVEIQLLPGEEAAAIRALATALEGDRPDSWRVEALGPRFQALATHVVAFRARVLTATARFKLGQDESDEGFGEIIAALGDCPLSRMMVQHRPAR